MSYTDDTSDHSDWKEAKMKGSKSIKPEHSASGNKKTRYFQRFCEKWLNIFQPWLARCEDDPNKPFCRACQCRLDCNKCHLQRHERTTKHVRNLEILVNKGEIAARENLSIRQERSKYYQRRKKLNSTQDLEAAMQEEDTMDEYVEETGMLENDTNFQFVQADAAGSGDQYSDEHPMKQEDTISRDSRNFARRKYKEHTNGHGTTKKGAAQIKKERDQLLIQLKQNKANIMDSFKELISNSTGIRLSQSPPKERNPVDLFFESVSSSVKALPLKMIAEAKMRVSQLVCELELRALTEFDGNQTNVSTPLVVSTEVNNTCIENQVTAGVHQLQEGSRRAQFVDLS